MKTAIVLCALISATSIAPRQAPPPKPSDDLVVQIAVHLYQGDRPAIGPASNGASLGLSGADAVAGYFWMNPSLCLVLDSGHEPTGTEKSTTTYNGKTSMPGAGWHVSGRLLQRTGDQFKVHVEWERIWDKSTRLANGPKGAQDVTLRPGESHRV